MSAPHTSKDKLLSQARISSPWNAPLVEEPLDHHDRSAGPSRLTWSAQSVPPGRVVNRIMGEASDDVVGDANRNFNEYES